MQAVALAASAKGADVGAEDRELRPDEPALDRRGDEVEDGVPPRGVETEEKEEDGDEKGELRGGERPSSLEADEDEEDDRERDRSEAQRRNLLTGGCRRKAKTVSATRAAKGPS